MHFVGTAGGSGLGSSVAGGDLDGDGLGDMVVGGSEGGLGSEGEVLVFFGIPGVGDGPSV